MSRIYKEQTYYCKPKKREERKSKVKRRAEEEIKKERERKKDKNFESNKKKKAIEGKLAALTGVIMALLNFVH